MSIKYILILCVIVQSLYSIQIQAQNTLYWRIFLKDKGSSEFKSGSPLYLSTEALHTEKSKNRRLKNNPDSLIFTIEDAPIYQPYLDTLQTYVNRVRLHLRWGNYVVVSADSNQINEVKKLSFVKNVQRTASKLFPQQKALSKNSTFINDPINNLKILTPDIDNCGIFRYGPSYNQAALLQVPFVHSLGITGKDALISFLDSGFRWKQHFATKNAQVLDERDYIQLDSITANQPGDVDGQDHHGSICFSTVSGFLQDSLIGISPHSSFLLAKTEDIPTEQHLEEDNYAAAVEWTESQGTDIISSSLGYSVFNQPDEENYLFSDFDGKTTITSKWVNKAVKRGVVCITAAGNDGPKDSTIITPSDADSVIAVAALAPDTTIAGFTSRGPRGDGKIKPDIAAQGVGVICIQHDDTTKLTSANGTSLATPLMAGISGLLLSAFPELTSSEVRRVFYATAKNAKEKNNAIGYGLANVKQAMLEAGIIVSPFITYPINNRQRVACYIMSKTAIVNPKLSVYNSNRLQLYTLYPTDTPHLFAADIPHNQIKNNTISCYVDIKDSEFRKRRYPVILPGYDSTVAISINQETYPCGIDTNLLPKHTYPMHVEEQLSTNINDHIEVKAGEILTINQYDIQGGLIHNTTLALPEGNYSINELPHIIHSSSWSALAIFKNNALLTTHIITPTY